MNCVNRIRLNAYLSLSPTVHRYSTCPMLNETHGYIPPITYHHYLMASTPLYCFETEIQYTLDRSEASMLGCSCWFTLRCGKEKQKSENCWP